MSFLEQNKSTIKSTNKSTFIFHTIIHEQFPFGGSHTGLAWWVLWSGHLLDGAVGVSLAAACAAGGRARLRGCLFLKLFRWSSGSRTGRDVTNLSGVVEGESAAPADGDGVASSRGSGRSLDCEPPLGQAGHRQGATTFRIVVRKWLASYSSSEMIGSIKQHTNSSNGWHFLPSRPRQILTTSWLMFKLAHGQEVLTMSPLVVRDGRFHATLSTENDGVRCCRKQHRWTCLYVCQSHLFFFCGKTPKNPQGFC